MILSFALSFFYSNFQIYTKAWSFDFMDDGIIDVIRKPLKENIYVYQDFYFSIFNRPTMWKKVGQESTLRRIERPWYNFSLTRPPLHTTNWYTSE